MKSFEEWGFGKWMQKHPECLTGDIPLIVYRLVWHKCTKLAIKNYLFNNQTDNSPD